MAWNMEEADIRRNLMDAGCSAAFIQRFAETLETGAACDCFRLLNSYRRVLLDDIHLQEERLTCLDHLRYHLKKV